MLVLFIILAAVIVACLIWAAYENNLLASREEARKKTNVAIRAFLIGICLTTEIWVIWSTKNPTALQYLRGKVTEKITYERIGDSCLTAIDTSFVWGGPIKVYSLDEVVEE